MKTLVFLLFVSLGPCWAGSSLELTTGTVTRSNLPAQPANGACRMEAMLHDVDTLPTDLGHSLQTPNACGFKWDWLTFSASDVRLQIYSERATGGSVCQIPGVQNYLGNGKGFYLRFQLAPSGAGGEQRCQAWGLDGNLFYSSTQAYTGTSGTNSNGVTITGAGAGKNISWGFFKFFTTNVSMQARMPVHSQDGDLLSWRFDGNLNDSSGHSYTGSYSGGTPSYDPATPGQDLIYGIVRTNPAPKWTDRRTLRVGVNNAMDATLSFSQADSSATVACDWSVLGTTPAAGLTLTIDNATNNCTPNFNPDTFGDYHVRLAMTDMGANTSNFDVHIGAAVMDAKGVVQLSSGASALFGPMIALGWNPWGLADEREVFAHSARRATYDATRATSPSFTNGNPEWDTARSGTVSYVWNGKGANLGGSCTTLSSDISSTSTSIAVADASCLDLSELPTRIAIQTTTSSYVYEEIRICATTGTTGAQTLTVCYDGRGADDASSLGSVIGASAWTAGASVGQYLVKGTGTDFMGGAEKICEAGVGPAGPIDYQAGTVSVTAGSATITGSGTTWNIANRVNGGDAIRIQGTYAGGTPFVFVAYVSSVDSTTQITANRVFPADADSASGLTYQIIPPFYRLINTGFTRPTYGGEAWVNWGSTGCESDTQTFFNPGYIGHDFPGMNGVAATGMHYSYMDLDFSVLNQSSTGGLNFYGEDLAWYSLWLRSGLAEPKISAESLANHWVRYPALLGGFTTSGPPLFVGGGVTGAVACLVVDPDCTLSWTDVRGFISQGKNYILTGTCTTGDSRDTGYLGNWLALGELFDPDTASGGFRDQWRSAHNQFWTLSNRCKGPDGSWSNGTYTNFAGSPTVAFINGSATGTGASLPANVCQGVARGTFTISGSTLTATSGTFSNASGAINIVLNDGNKRVFTAIQYIDATHAGLAIAWPGATAGNWMQLTGTGSDVVGFTTWGQDVNSASLPQNYECMQQDTSTIILERPWAGQTGSYQRYTALLAGFGQQPYMLSIKLFGFVLASQLDKDLGSDFAGLRNAAAAYVANVGYDPEVKGMRYGTGFQSCEPPLTATAVATWKQPGCSFGTSAPAQVGARMLNGESARGFVYNPINTLTRGDEAYAALWCSTQYNDTTLYPGIPACDAAAPGDNLGLSNLGDSSLTGGKWSGFFFGMGMAHQWPAMRLLGNFNGNPRLGGQAGTTGKIQ